MKVYGKGNANVVLGKDGEDDEWLFRVCTRHMSSLRQLNEYTRMNYRFICDVVVPLAGEALVCEMKLGTLAYKDVMQFVNVNVKGKEKHVEEDEVIAIRIRNLSMAEEGKTVYDSHQLKIVVNEENGEVAMELKPKWIFNPPDLQYCRNCMLNKYKKRGEKDTKLCFACYKNNCYDWVQTLLQDTKNQLPCQFKDWMVQYFSPRQDNVLTKVYNIQEQLYDISPALAQLESERDVTTELMLLMILRDVTVMIHWQELFPVPTVKIVDLDLKPRDKWRHWRETAELLDNYHHQHLNDSYNLPSSSG
ncbi:hypothetical protein NCAS_0F02820 [Naumovozyma castellii]|uniref:Inositol-pentakisphosphate 2-kinase n=1 Tax=Naumovozyma castellii TaxID=27288 RepID=G0VGZ5_NAUCA|nr:hypothetical protein NCAS_0F02820 [Naumovozyma castellii CBS 4309]CCC70766.1 hypothetical protein NCAS_0F02820 [Naumovozyma castellii CBS 4309]